MNFPQGCFAINHVNHVNHVNLRDYLQPQIPLESGISFKANKLRGESFNLSLRC